MFWTVWGGQSQLCPGFHPRPPQIVQFEQCKAEILVVLGLKHQLVPYWTQMMSMMTWTAPSHVMCIIRMLLSSLKRAVCWNSGVHTTKMGLYPHWATCALTKAHITDNPFVSSLWSGSDKKESMHPLVEVKAANFQGNHAWIFTSKRWGVMWNQQSMANKHSLNFTVIKYLWRKSLLHSTDVGGRSAGSAVLFACHEIAAGPQKGMTKELLVAKEEAVTLINQ